MKLIALLNRYTNRTLRVWLLVYLAAISLLCVNVKRRAKYESDIDVIATGKGWILYRDKRDSNEYLRVPDGTLIQLHKKVHTELSPLITNRECCQ